MSTDNLPAVRNGAAPARLQLGGSEAMKATIEDLNTIRAFVSSQMQEGLDFGTIPGTGSKPTLLLPGAQKVNMYFNVYPEYEVQTSHLDGGHINVVVKTRLLSRASQSPVGNGIGSCSSMESKYRWRQQARSCPDCGNGEAVIKGKKEYGGGWICFAKKGGCGAKFRDNDSRITDQPVGRIENPDIYDTHNTVLKMAKKRSLVDATHGLGCMSELFTQDLEDFQPEEVAAPPAPAPRQPSPPPPGPDNASGYGRGQYASPEQVEAYREWARVFVADANTAWLDRWTGADGAVADGIGDILRVPQLTGHMLKWALRTERLKPVDMTFDPESGKPVERVSTSKAEKYVAIPFVRDTSAFMEEAGNYTNQQRAEAREAWEEKHGVDPDADLETTEAGARG